MTLDFDSTQVKTVEFGVGRDDGDGQTFCLLAVDGDVQDALREMAGATWEAMQELTDSPPKYEPSEKHESSEYLHLPLDDDLERGCGNCIKQATCPWIRPRCPTLRRCSATSRV